MPLSPELPWVSYTCEAVILYVMIDIVFWTHEHPYIAPIYLYCHKRPHGWSLKYTIEWPTMPYAGPFVFTS